MLPLKKEVYIDPVVMTLLKDMSVSNNNKVGILRVKNATMILESLFDFELSKDNFEKLPKNEPRYILLRSQKIRHKDHLPQKLILFYWCPRLAILKDKIEYTSARTSLLNALPRGSYTLFLNNIRGLMRLTR
ncbi:TPA: hypothetical protein ACYUTM_004923 [Serratia marcescens]|uniref:hypothetical protein n=1 Tax=Serratia sp. TMDUHS_CL TaxID=3128862 RepID=UPI0029DB76DB|nr:hypothetical protein [Serratia marcescens]